MLMRSLILKGSALGPIERMVRESKMFKPLVHRFVAGDTLDEALAAADEILAKGMMVSLDFLGENTHSKEEALQAKATYIAMLNRIAARKDHVASPADGYADGAVEQLNISIKLTQCGLDQGEKFAEQNYREVLSAAKEQGNFVRVDMEASDYTQRTINMLDRVLDDFPNTGTVLQSYLFRTPQDIDWVMLRRCRVRLVKGAYLEDTDVAYAEKHQVDVAYVNLAKELLENAVYPAIATQDEVIIHELNDFVKEKGIDKQKFEYQMLYGIRRDLQDMLVREGYRVRIYIPFGDSWYPYFTRRLAERPANALFIVKNLFRG